ncbi:hypothetical protein BJ970_004528 [Saccharopolyspora phatthalungensis]|uniref:Uncharacterized protein n=1 Tax=Saccharopolyspora phatthalungensis TaxID=664693 RepID=A0A840Q8D5_9PSEU|nr:hypothetical protein [Saccharopolyspora phatthalungensis]
MRANGDGAACPDSRDEKLGFNDDGSIDLYI